MNLRQLNPEDLKIRQRFLKSCNFDCGKIDGVYGPWTQKAEDAYQESKTHIDQVKSVQTFLNKQGAKLDVDGVYGEATRAAELKYQDLLKDTDSSSPVVTVAGDDRSKIIQVAKSLIGTRELTGRNDGVTVDAMLDSCGLKGTKNPYCACFVVYCGDMALGRKSNPYPRSAWSPDMVKKPTWKQGLGGKTPQPADTFGLYFAKQGRVAHTGLICEWPEKEKYCTTLEGNTGATGSVGEADRNGDGVYLKRRNKTDIYAVQNWIQ